MPGVAAAIALNGAACGRDQAAEVLPPLAGPVAIERAAAWPTGRMATLGFRVRVAAPDTLREVLVDGATDVSMHLAGPGGKGMIPVEEVPVFPGPGVVFNEGGPHVMIMGLAAPLTPGDSIRVMLRFARAGERALAVPVLRYTEAVRFIGN